MAIQQFLQYIATEKRYSKHTIQAYQKDVCEFQHYIQHTYNTTILNCKTDYVRSWLAELLQNGYSAKTVNRKLSTLKSLFKFLQHQKLVSENPVQLLRALKTPESLPVITKVSELTELINSLPKHDFSSCRDALLIELFYYTGVRREELINIKLKDIYLNREMLQVLGKGNKVRTIPIVYPLKQSIQTYLTFREGIANCDYLFVTDKGKKLYPNFVYRKINNLLSVFTTQSKKSPHTLRHSFASHLLNSGADLMSIKELLGHESLQATQVYTHTNIEELKKIYKKTHPTIKK